MDKEKSPDVREDGTAAPPTAAPPAAAPTVAKKPPKRGLSVYEIVLFPILGALMFATTLLLQVLPNIHMLGLFIVAFTVVFRAKALWPIGIFLALDGFYNAFAPTWLPYLYVFPLLWAAVMLLPKQMPRKVQFVVYPLVSGLHGLLFGTLYTPGWALATGLPVSAWGAWILSGLPYDAIHAASNVIAGLLVVPLAELMRKLLANRK